MSEGLLETLHQRGIITLNQIDKPEGTNIWAQAWKNAEDLRLDIQWEKEWQGYILELR